MKYMISTSLFISMLIFSACSVASDPLRTGFLSDYDGFQHVSAGDMHYFQRLDDANLSWYDKMFIPEIKVFSNTAEPSFGDSRLYSEITAYTTAAYRKNIMKKSANYCLVDVAQEGTMLMEIAISTVEVHPSDEKWDNLTALPFSINDRTKKSYEEGSVRILIEARISDAMNNDLLARSMRVIMKEEVRVDSDQLSFKDIQASLDRWLYDSAIAY